MFLQKQIFMVSDECTLLKQFKSGEREAFDRLFKMYAPQLGYFCLRLVRQEDAEEIVQETFIKLWETRDKIKVELNFNTTSLMSAYVQPFSTIDSKKKRTLWKTLSIMSFAVEDIMWT